MSSKSSATTPSSSSSSLNRVVVLGESQANKGFPSNKLQTAKFETNWQLLFYGLISCIFSSVASVYFFTVGLLQMFTPWSPTGKFATMGPYGSNKLFEMATLFWFNKKDRNTDKKVNSRKVKVITRNGMYTKERKDLKVGDLIYVEEASHGGVGEERLEVPADLLLVYSDTRSVFLDMSSLTGEKDSVQRKVPNGLEIEKPENVPLYGVLYTTEPKPDLDHFKGELHIGTKKYDCTYENIILAGSYLFKGRDVYGIVIATGMDTKIRLKQKPASKKSWSLQNRLNIITTITLLFLSTFIALGTYGYISTHGGIIFQVVTTYFLLFNGLIAQTLQFTLDAVRGIQTFEIDAEVKNPCAVEQLGLVQAMVFDKTGTLTQNKLEPQVLSVVADGDYQIHDKKLGKPIFILPNERSVQLKELLLAICINNSVMRAKEGRFNESPNYFGTSADEVALLESAYNSVGYCIVSRTITPEGEELELHTGPDDHHKNRFWQVLYTYKYTSERGMMTLMVRNKTTGEVFFYSKGSPEKMYSYLREEDREEAENRVNDLAKKGLRVLLYAAVKLDWNLIKDDFSRAIASQEEDGVAVQIFRRDYLKDMYALGATGTEDQLQPRLSETINKIQSGKIITLMCTGDIKLTAEIIGKNCGILPSHPGSQIFDIHDHPDYSLDVQLDEALKFTNPKGLLVGKQELMDILNDKTLCKAFFELVRTCRGVVTYRAHPKLKAQLTRFLMKNGLITCSVGDGANDIDMIKQANVGVGIKDGENSHAVGSSDLAIKRVGELPKLIFYHGKQNWERNTRMTHLITCMKMTVVLCLLFYDFFYDGFHALSLFTGRMLLAYNFFYGWATAVYGIFHRSYRSPEEALEHPEQFLSKPEFSLRALSLSRSIFWWIKAMIDAAICLTITMYWWDNPRMQDITADIGSDGIIPSPTGLSPPFFIFGDNLVMSEFCAFVVIMIWVNLRVSLETDHAYVQYAVAATLVSFFSVAVLPVWKYLSPGFLPYVIFMVALFLAYNYVLNTLTRALGHLSETSSTAAPTLKWETVQKIEDMRKAERKRSEAAKLKSLDADREEEEEEAKNVLGIVELIPPSSSPPPTHVSPTTPTRHMHLRRRSSVLEDSTCAPINNNNHDHNNHV